MDKRMLIENDDDSFNS